MNKKLVASLLTVAMVISSTVMAFAAGTGSVSQTSIKHEGTVETPTIEVNINAADNTIVANPYGLAVTGLAQVNGKYPTLKGDKITVTNAGNMKVAVGITGKVEVSNNLVKIMTSSSGMDKLTQYKQIYVQGLVTLDGTEDKILYNKPAADGGKAMSPVAYTAKGAVFTNEPVLAPTGDANGKNVCILVIDGATSYPADSQWTDDDGFKVTTTFDIKATTNNVSEYGKKATS